MWEEENLDEVVDEKEGYHCAYVVAEEQKLVVVLPFSDHIVAVAVAVVLEVIDFEVETCLLAKNTVVMEDFVFPVEVAAAVGIVEVVVEDRRFVLVGDNFFHLDTLILEVSQLRTCRFHFRWTDHEIVIEGVLVFLY